MMDEQDIDLGQIKMVDNIKKSGVIKSKGDGTLFYFQFSDMELGAPREGEEVQYVKDMNGMSPMAKKIVVLSTAARRAQRSYK